jgi:hypothetical protein
MTRKRIATPSSTLSETADTVVIGIPYYGPQEAVFWSSLAMLISVLPLQDIDFYGLVTIGAMSTDYNRNQIVDGFLKLPAEWLFWIDSDMEIPKGAIRRLLDMGKTLASGIYYGKGEPHPAIAYHRTPDGAYAPIDKRSTWRRGEIIPVDAAGMGCMLTHRSVYEDIRATHRIVQRANGGRMVLHKDDIHGDLTNGKAHPYARKVHKGVYYEPVCETSVDSSVFPYFGTELTKTEDLWFFELAARAGHKPWLDTSVECGHISSIPFTGSDYRAYIKLEELAKANASIRDWSEY